MDIVSKLTIMQHSPVYYIFEAPSSLCCAWHCPEIIQAISLPVLRVPEYVTCSHSRKSRWSCCMPSRTSKFLVIYSIGQPLRGAFVMCGMRRRRSEVEEEKKPEQINNYFRNARQRAIQRRWTRCIEGKGKNRITIKDIKMYLKPINCSAGGAVLAGCVGFVATAASSHHSGKAARKLEKLSVIALKENIT